MGLGWAARGLIELGQRERGAQLEAAGFLLLGDGDGGEEGGFGGGGVLFEEDFAAKGVIPNIPIVASAIRRDAIAGEEPQDAGDAYLDRRS